MLCDPNILRHDSGGSSGGATSAEVELRAHLCMRMEFRASSSYRPIVAQGYPDVRSWWSNRTDLTRSSRLRASDPKPTIISLSQQPASSAPAEHRPSRWALRRRKRSRNVVEQIALGNFRYVTDSADPPVAPHEAFAFAFASAQARVSSIGFTPRAEIGRAHV